MSWRVLCEDGVGAAEGLATDELLARRAGQRRSPATLRLYTYRPHVALVGRFQDLALEVDLAYCEQVGIGYNRRPTGGGAILMGPAQCGIAVATCGPAGGVRALMRGFSRGILDALAGLGVAASFRGKNDLEVDGRKIAGLGLARESGGGLLFHASLLVDLDVELMARVLKTPFADAGEQELAIVADRTTTLRRLVGSGLSMHDLRARLVASFAAVLDASIEDGELTPSETAEVAALVRDKYATRAWIDERVDVRSRKASSELRTEAGRLRVHVALAGGTIQALSLRGDFIAADAAVADLEGRLRWHSTRPDVIDASLRAWAASHADCDLQPSLVKRAILEAVGAAGDAARGEPYGCFVSPEVGRD